MPQWDYSSEGYYFVTICIKNRDYVFGDVRDGQMISNHLGKLAEKCWSEIPTHFPDVEIGEFVVMPNHVHGIVVIEENCDGIRRGCKFASPTNVEIDRSRMTLSKVVHGFKAAVTRGHNKFSDNHFTWQRSFYDRIVRNEDELEKIYDYIKFNPDSWRDDDFFVQSD